MEPMGETMGRAKSPPPRRCVEETEGRGGRFPTCRLSLKVQRRRDGLKVRPHDRDVAAGFQPAEYDARRRLLWTNEATIE